MNLVCNARILSAGCAQGKMARICNSPFFCYMQSLNYDWLWISPKPIFRKQIRSKAFLFQNEGKFNILVFKILSIDHPYCNVK